ncbi:MAG: sugar ABC transporter substrate-binding protein [Aristaeellaceae bacterium]
MNRIIRGGLKLLPLLVLVLALSGCNGEKQESPEPVKLTALQYELENQSMDFAGMWFYRQLEEKTNVHVEFDEVKDADWTTRLSLMFASNDYRDMILRGSLDVEDYGVSQHQLMALDEYLESCMPNYAARLSMDGAGDAIPSSDGHSYYVGFLLSQNINTDGHFFINRQWLEKLGLAMPTTIEELTEVLRAFRDGDPNGNGLHDEVPYQATFDNCNTGIYNAFSHWGIPMNEWYVFADEQGRVHFAPEEEGFRECLEWLHLLCQEKLLDVECITQGSNLWGAKMNENTAGYFSYWRLNNTALRQEIADQFVCMLPVSAEGCQAQLGRLMDVVEFGAALTVHNEQVEASLRWLDAQFDTETMLVAQNGAVGDTLRLREDGRYEVVYVPQGNELYKTVPVLCGQFFAPASYYEAVYEPAPHRKEKSGFSAYYEEAGVLEPVSHRLLTHVMPKTGDEAARINQLYTRLKTLIDSSLVNFMTNGVADDSFNAFLAELRQAGAEEYRMLYQHSYDRYLSR